MRQIMNLVLVDDNKNCLDLLSEYIGQSDFNCDILAKCSSPKEAIKAINRLKPHAIFVAVEMPFINGIEMLEMIPNRDFEVVIIAPNGEYAMSAFNLDAVHYIVKPLDSEEINMSLLKLERRIGFQTLENQAIHGNGNGNGKENARDLQVPNIKPVKKQQYHSEEPVFSDDRLVIPTCDGYQFISKRDIAYCSSNGNYSQIILGNNRKVIVTKQLKELERLLNHDYFIRVHKSYLVNTNYIDKYVKTEGGYIVMNNGDVVRVSRKKKGVFSSMG